MQDPLSMSLDDLIKTSKKSRSGNTRGRGGRGPLDPDPPAACPIALRYTWLRPRRRRLRGNTTCIRILGRRLTRFQLEEPRLSKLEPSSTSPILIMAFPTRTLRNWNQALHLQILVSTLQQPSQ
ncbi:hypothetical protein ACFX2F_017336 [Malus domestica]